RHPCTAGVARAAAARRARSARGGAHRRARGARGRGPRRGGRTGGPGSGAARMKAVPFEPLEPALYRELVRRALAEDLGWGDVTTEGTIRPEQRARGIIVAKAPCVIAGLGVAAETFRQLDPAVVFHTRCEDGARCEVGAVVADVRGSAAS